MILKTIPSSPPIRYLVVASRNGYFVATSPDKLWLISISGFRQYARGKHAVTDIVNRHLWYLQQHLQDAKTR